MKHPLHKLGKKNRNVISGILVGIASIFIVAHYVDLPFEEIKSSLLATLLFVFGIAILATITIAIFKLISKLISSFLNKK